MRFLKHVFFKHMTHVTCRVHVKMLFYCKYRIVVKSAWDYDLLVLGRDTDKEKILMKIYVRAWIK